MLLNTNQEFSCNFEENLLHDLLMGLHTLCRGSVAAIFGILHYCHVEAISPPFYHYSIAIILSRMVGLLVQVGKFVSKQVKSSQVSA